MWEINETKTHRLCSSNIKEIISYNLIWIMMSYERIVFGYSIKSEYPIDASLYMTKDSYIGGIWGGVLITCLMFMIQLAWYSRNLVEL